MNEEKVRYFISSPRFNIYLAHTGNDFDKSYRLYKANIELSEAFYPVLALLEISLRNAINEKLKVHFNDAFWFKNCLPQEFQSSIKEAEQKILSQRKVITADRVIAELSFGFWNRLFNRYYGKLLWKTLFHVFPNLPKHDRKRDTIDDALFQIRTLRNRVYHYEPIFRNLTDIEEHYCCMILFLKWMDFDLPDMLDGIDRFQEILVKAKAI